MSSIPCEGGSRILHVRPEPGNNAATDNMDADLAAASASVETCPDVYVGLARIGRSPQGTHRAVIVNVDFVGDEEMEFFALAARLQPSLDVFVYGDDRARSRMARACELGAAGVATPEIIRRLSLHAAPTPVVARVADPIRPRPPVVPPRPPEAESVPQSSPPAVTEPPYVASVRAAARVPPVAEDGPDAVDLLADEPEEEADETDAGVGEDAEDEPASVRVPWLRYGGAPARTAPRDGSPPVPEPTPSERPRSRAFLHEPLLTDEELRALLGDAKPDDGAFDSQESARESEDDRP